MSYRVSALLQAVSSGDATRVSSMIADGADVNATNDGGQTLLILAIVSAQHHLLRLLLEAGANPLLRDSTGLNAIDWAERKGRIDLAQLLAGKTQEIQPHGSGRIVASGNGSRLTTEELPRTKALTADEKSRRFLAGLKQRLDEKADRELTRSAHPQPPKPKLPSQPEPAHILEAPIITPAEPEPSVVIDSQPTPAPLMSSKPSHRKRCPECNRVYNSELLAYCSYHIVPLVDADLPVVPPKTSKSSAIVLWAFVLITLAVAAFAGLFLTNLLFRNSGDQSDQPTGAPAIKVRKGIPVLGRDLVGKAVMLPEAAAPMTPLAQATTVIVQVKIDKSGRVYSATSSNGDRSLREASVDAAKKSTFSIEKLRAHGTDGTITYTFNP